MNAQVQNTKAAVAGYMLCCLIAVANLVSIMYADAFKAPSDIYTCAIDRAATNLDHLGRP